MMSESIRGGYKMTEMGELPEEWKVIGLNQLLSLEYGLGLPERKRTGNGFPVYGSNGIVGFHREYFISSKGIVIGRKGTIGSVTLTKGSFWPIDTTYYIKLKQKSSFYWLYYLLFNLDLNKLDSSTGIPGLNRNDVYNLRVPLPPLPEQHRIAEILSTIDETIERTEALIEKYRHIKAGLMGDLLTRGIDEEGRIRSEETHEFKDSPLGRVPKMWKVEKIKDVVQNKKGSIKIGPFGSQLKLEDLVKKGFKVYGQENIINKNFQNGDRYLTHEKYNSLKSCTIFPGDLVITMMGTIGKCMIFPDEFNIGIMDSHLLRIQPDKSILITHYLALIFENYQEIQKQIGRLSQGGIMSGLSSAIIKEINIPLPPIPEQHHIAEILTATDTYIEKEQTYLNKLQQIKKGLMQDLLTGKVRVTTTPALPKPSEAAT
jgi:type I restriction enzyme S subunit